MMSAVTVLAPRVLVTRTMLDVSSFVDELPSGVAGELVFEGGASAATGAVFVDGSRICWAAARGLARRLGDLLAASLGVDRAGMEALYVACKEARIPLGEYLVRTGRIEEAALRAALLAHSAESLRLLCGEGDRRARWVERQAGGYSSRSTFTTTELLTRSFADRYGVVGDSLTDALDAVIGGGGWGAAYLRSGEHAHPEPVAVRGAFPPRIRSVVRLGQWATSALDVVPGGGGAVVASQLADAAVSAWRSGPAVLACWTTPQGPARLLNLRSRARLERARDGGQGQGHGDV